MTRRSYRRVYLGLSFGGLESMPIRAESIASGGQARLLKQQLRAYILVHKPETKLTGNGMDF